MSDKGEFEADGGRRDTLLPLEGIQASVGRDEGIQGALGNGMGLPPGADSRKVLPDPFLWAAILHGLQSPPYFPPPHLLAPRSGSWPVYFGKPEACTRGLLSIKFSRERFRGAISSVSLPARIRFSEEGPIRRHEPGFYQDFRSDFNTILPFSHLTRL
jgi:hypothetical protein